MPASPALFPASLAQGFSLMISQGQMGVQALINQQAQNVQMFSKSMQQGQVNFLNTLNQLIVGPAAQMARPPLVPIPMASGGEGFAPSGFFPEWQPKAVAEKTQQVVPYFPLTEGQTDFRKGGFTEAPQEMMASPPAPGKLRPKTEFF
jgi:hypothetical protein